MRGIALVLILLPTTLPAAAQTILGVRAGVGSARMVPGPGHVVFEPCRLGLECPGLANGSKRSFTFGADLSLPLWTGGFELRVGGAYSKKGGIGSGRDANGQTLKGELSIGYLQLSSLLRAVARARPPSRLSVGVLIGPWIAIRLACSEDGQLIGGCRGTDPDAGFAVGFGVEAALYAGSRLGVDAIYHRGLKDVSGVGEETRFVAIQAGFVFPVN